MTHAPPTTPFSFTLLGKTILNQPVNSNFSSQAETNFMIETRIIHLVVAILYDSRNNILFSPIPQKIGHMLTEAVPSIKIKLGDCPHKAMSTALSSKKICKENFVLQNNYAKLFFFDDETNKYFHLYVFVQKITVDHLHEGVVKHFESPDGLINYWLQNKKPYRTGRGYWITKMNLASLSHVFLKIKKRIVA